MGNFKVSTNELLFAILYGRWSLSFREEHGNCLRDDVRSLLWLHYDPPPIVNQVEAHDTSPDVSANISLLSDHYHQHQMMTPFRKACSSCTTFRQETLTVFEGILHISILNTSRFIVQSQKKKDHCETLKVFKNPIVLKKP